MIEIKIRMFGTFRKYERGPDLLSLQMESPVTVENFKAALARRLHERFTDFENDGDQLIKDSAVADESQVLAPETVLVNSCTLSILPPVCGG